MTLRARFGWHDGTSSQDVFLPVVDVLEYGQHGAVVVRVLGPAGATVRTVDIGRLSIR